MHALRIIAVPRHLVGVTAAAILISTYVPPLRGADEDRLMSFEQSIEAFRQQYQLPGLSAAIVRNQQIIWEKGFGFQNIEDRVAATPDTPYLIASLTKTFTSLLLMKCDEEGRLNLDAPIRNYSSQIPDAGVTVRHVFTHTSESRPPGEAYRYNGNRFGALGAVVNACLSVPYREATARFILDPAALLDTVPGKDFARPSPALLAAFGSETIARYGAVLNRLAKPYRVDTRGQFVLNAYPQEDINASAGMISTVRDLALYDSAIDRHVFIKSETQETAWRNHVNSRGQPLPYALGWFVRYVGGERVVWHYGSWPDAFSSLILKVPGHSMTLILLANGGGLSTFPSIGSGNIAGTPFADAFLRIIREPGAFLPGSPAVQSRGIVNAASGAPGAAPSTWLSIYGQGFLQGGEGRQWRTDDFADGMLPTELDGVKVRFAGRTIPLSYVSMTQINALAPDDLPPGPVAVEIETPTGTASGVVEMQDFLPALFTLANGGQHYAAAVGQRGELVGNEAADRRTRPVQPREVISLFGTGFGVTSPARPVWQVPDAAPLVNTVKVGVGDGTAELLFGGLVGPGVYQFNIVVPDVSDGHHLVFVEIAGRRTQAGVHLHVRR